MSRRRALADGHVRQEVRGRLQEARGKQPAARFSEGSSSTYTRTHIMHMPVVSTHT